MFTKRASYLFGIALTVIIAATIGSLQLLHKEFKQLESATESLFYNEHYEEENLQSKVDDIDANIKAYLVQKGDETYTASKSSLQYYRELVSHHPLPAGELGKALDTIDSLLSKIRSGDLAIDEAPALLRRPLDTLSSNCQRLAQKAQEDRTWQLVEMERSFDRLFIRIGVGSFLFVCLLTWQLITFYQKRIRPMSARLIEQELKMQAQEKLMALALLASGIAHEIRSPLAAIKARVFTLKNTAGSDPSVAEDCAAISAEVLRMEKIVKSFLQFARPGEPELSRFKPAELIGEIVEDLQESFLKHGIQLQQNKLSRSQVLADKDQIRQCLINLLNNAKDSIESRGRIEIDAQITTNKSIKADGPVLRIDITDTGKGIPIDQHERLFDPFYTTKKSGTGLGLPLTQVLIGKQGGRIEFQSEVGVGSVFSIYLPIDPVPLKQ